MRIRSIEVTEHPMLGTFRYGDFDVETQKKDIATFFVGANGSGKSFFLEAVVDIFQTIYEDKKTSFSFVLQISHENHVCTIRAQKEHRPIAELPEGKEEADFLPKNLIYYYSGETKRAFEYFKSYYEKHRTATIKGAPVTIPEFFYIDPELANIILLTHLIYRTDNITENVLRHINIDRVVNLSMSFNPQKSWLRNFKTHEDANINFWGALGELSEFCNVLYDVSELRKTLPTKVETDENEIEEYDFVIELLLNPADFNILRDLINSPKRFFELLVNLKASGLLKDIHLSIVKRGSNSVFKAEQLSEGEKQFLLVLGFLELAQREKTLLLIDEPDTHLNPLWKYYYMKNLQDLVTTNPADIEMFICSHDPLLISGLEAEQVLFVDREGDNINLSRAGEDLMGKGVEAILTSPLFGLATTLDYKTNEKIIERRKLIAKGVYRKLHRADLKKLDSLTRELRGIDFTIPYNDPAFVEYLAKIGEEKLTSYSQPFNTATHYEVRQKAKKLFKSTSNDQD